MNKKIIISGLLATLATTSFAFAEEGTVTAQPTLMTVTSAHIEDNHEKKELRVASSTKQIARDAARLAKLKAEAKREITMRVNSLTKLFAKINAAKKVSPDYKATASSTIATTISSLQALGTKIEQGTSTEQVKLDTASITKAYRVYNLLIPQIGVMTKANEILTQGETLASTTLSLRDRSAKALAAGKDVTVINATLADADAHRASSTMLVVQAISSITSLTADNGDKTIAANNALALKNAEASLKKARAEMQITQNDLYKARQALRALKF